MNTTGRWIWLPLFAIAIIAGLYLLYTPNNKVDEIQNTSGIRLILSPDTSNQNWPSKPIERKSVLDNCRITMLNRLADLDFSSDPKVVVRDDGKIEVFLPGNKEHAEAKARITSGDALELYLLTDVQSEANPYGRWRMQGPIHTGEAYTFISPSGGEINTLNTPQKFLSKVVGAPKTKSVFSSDDFLPNAKAIRSQDKFAVLEVAFNPDASKHFAEFTKNNVGGILGVLYGGKLLMAPAIREEIPDGKAQITGFANIDEAKRIAEMINSGNLVVGFHIESEETIKPGK